MLVALARIFHQGRARVSCATVRWQGCSRAFKPQAACLRNDWRLQAPVRPARATTQWADAHKEEQRGQRAVTRPNRVRSARYKLALVLEAKKASSHGVLSGIRERPGEICGLNRRACRGISLVELMVGMALGLFIVATALFLLTEHLRENRSLLLQARLQQDLRVTLDLMSRHLQRAGHWGTPQAAIWQTDGQANSLPQTNPYTAWAPNPTSVLFHTSRDTQENQQIDSNETLGFRLQQGVLQMRLGAAGWQALTDPEVMQITQLQIQPQVHEQTLADLCHRPCPPASNTCPPRQQVRSLRINIHASATHEAQVQRSLQTQVRLRNDAVIGSCPA